MSERALNRGSEGVTRSSPRWSGGYPHRLAAAPSRLRLRGPAPVRDHRRFRPSPTAARGWR